MIRNKQNEIAQWSCTACTYLNDIGQIKCAMCNTIKPNQWQNNFNQLNLSNGCYDEYSYYDQDLNQYDDVEWDSSSKKLTRITFPTAKKKKRKKKMNHAKQINKNISVKYMKQSSKTTLEWPVNKSSSTKPLKIVYNVDILSCVELKICDNDTKEIENKINSSEINYKQYAENLGLFIKWSKKPEYIFPYYRATSGAMVTQYRTDVAKNVVCLLIKQEKNNIAKAFKQFADKIYFGKQEKIILKVDIARAIERVKTAEIQEDDTETFGEADECNVWITKCSMSDEDIIGTLLHESLHFIAALNGREMCEKDEHAVIKMLGDRF